jgi:hypothetical protein
VLLRADTTTGDRSAVSGGGLLGGKVGQGKRFTRFEDLALLPDGDIVAAMAGGATGRQPPRILRIDPATGNRTVIRDHVGESVAVEAAGTLLVPHNNGLARLEPATGALTPVSGTTRGAGPPLISGGKIAIGADGSVYMITRHPAAGTGSRSAIVRIDPVTGDRVYVSR